MILEQQWFRGWPDHVWPGVICTNQADAKLRVWNLLRVPSKVHWILAQPLLEAIDFAYWINRIDQIIVSGESAQRAEFGNAQRGPGRIDREWVRLVKNQCHDKGKSFFFAKWGDARDRRNGAVEVLGRKCDVPELYGSTFTQVPGQEDKFEPRTESSTLEVPSQQPHLEHVPNVGDDARDNTGIYVTMGNGCAEPDEKSSFEHTCHYIKSLCAARETFEDEFDIKIARMLLLAKRDFEKRKLNGDFDLVASDLTGVARSMIPKYLQIAREISDAQWKQIPEQHRKVRHLLALARQMKKDLDLPQALEWLASQKKVGAKPSENAIPVAGGGEDAPPSEPLASETRKPRRPKTLDYDGLREFAPGSRPLLEPLPGYDVTLAVPLDGVTAAREYVERLLREEPEQLMLSLQEARVHVRVRIKPLKKDG
jgi:hypothetical protein